MQIFGGNPVRPAVVQRSVKPLYVGTGFVVNGTRWVRVDRRAFMISNGSVDWCS